MLFFLTSNILILNAEKVDFLPTTDINPIIALIYSFLRVIGTILYLRSIKTAVALGTCEILNYWPHAPKNFLWGDVL